MNSFLWFLTLANVGACHFLGLSFGRRTANASILMKFRTLHKSRAVNSMVARAFCNFWRLSLLTPVNVGNCPLLALTFGRRTANASILMKFRTLHKLRLVNSMVAIFFCDSWCLSILTSVNIGTCHVLGHKFGRRTTNALILIRFYILHKSKALSSMVTIVFLVFDARLSNLTPVN